MTDERWIRTSALIGDDSLEKLKNCRIAVFGIGGVGSFTTEALARSGVGNLDIFDSDRVDITNINRQIIALTSTVGSLKTTVMARRLMDINPNIQVKEYPHFVTPDYLKNVDFSVFDYVVDAVDNVTAKIEICKKSRENNIPVISSMGAGNKLDPTKFQVDLVEKTSVCPLARVMRLELRKRNITGVKAVYSKEPAIKTQDEGRTAPKSISFVPSVAGLIIASEVVLDIIGRKADLK